jgi:hypothetical protein
VCDADFIKYVGVAAGQVAYDYVRLINERHNVLDNCWAFSDLIRAPRP